MPLYTSLPSGERKVLGVVVVRGQSGLGKFCRSDGPHARAPRLRNWV